MKRILAFPQLGDYQHPIGKFLKKVTNLEVITTPPITRKTIELGSKYSPDSVCVPFKYNIGNFIEALDLGANTLLQAGGGCRYRYYAEVQETILKDLGYNFELIQIIGNDSLNFKEAFSIFKKLNPTLTRREFLKEIIATLLYIYYLDSIDSKIRKFVGFEKQNGSFLKLKKRFISECNSAKGIFSLTKIYRNTLRRLKTIPIDKPKDCLKVGIIGELYTAMEPYSNYELEKTLASYHIEIKRFTNVSYLLWQKKFLSPYMKFRVRKYCKYTLGADALDNVYRIGYLKRHKFDGIIHTKPTGCTPEIGAIPIMIKEAKDLNIPITFFSFDEQSGLDGIRTRLEAFYDLLNFKREG